MPASRVLRGLPAERLESMAAAADEVMACMRALEKGGSNLVAELLRGVAVMQPYEHYPPGDVFDHETHAQYYYHAHRTGAREHGHFHTFLRQPGMPARCRPARIGGRVPRSRQRDRLSHLVAISMDIRGRPFRLFTVNRWVTGETWYAADDVIAMLDRFAIDHASPSWPVNRWVGAILRLFHPVAADLVRQRDAMVAAWAASHPDLNALEDRRLEVAAWTDIALERYIGQVRRALK